MKKRIEIKSSLVKLQNGVLQKIEYDLKSFSHRKALDLKHDLSVLVNHCKTLDDYVRVKDSIVKTQKSHFTHNYILPFAQNVEVINAIKAQLNDLIKTNNGRATAHVFTNPQFFFEAVLEMQKTGEKTKTMISGDALPKAYFKKSFSVKRNRATVEKLGSNYVLTEFEIFNSRS